MFTGQPSSDAFLADPLVKWPLIGRIRNTLGQRAATAVIVSAAALLLLAGLAIIKIAGTPSPAQMETAQPALQHPAQNPGSAPPAQASSRQVAHPGAQTRPAGDTGKRVAQATPKQPGAEQQKGPAVSSRPDTTAEATSGKAGAGSSAPPSRSARNPAALATEALTLSFPVIHDHVLGSCSWTLTVSWDTLSWNPENQKDGFALECSQFSCGIRQSIDDKVRRDNLPIQTKRGPKERGRPHSA